MFRTIFILTLLLVTTSVFSQSRFMVGISVNPNLSFHQSDYNLHYNPGFSFGVGANFGIHLGKRLFLLTGIEKTGEYYKGKGNLPVASGNYGTTENIRALDVPVLFNYVVTNTTKRIYFFVTAGIYYGRYTYISHNEIDRNSFIYSFTERGKEIINPAYGGFIAGFGCKINLNEKYSLLIIPDYNSRIPTLVELRTMLVYNFGKMKK